ncbi:MAG: hypothetical protein ACR2J3_02115 [Aridibacter sp.]
MISVVADATATFSLLSKDYERLPETSEAFIQIAMMRLMLLRLKPN